jgi:predicted metalloenzyme YecM
MNNRLNDKRSLLFGPVETHQGSKLSEAEILIVALEKFPGKKYYPMKNWMIIDILLPNGSKNHPTNNQASVLIELSDTGNALSKTKFINIQIIFEDCFLETKDSVYILMGTGLRQRMSESLESRILLI